MPKSNEMIHRTVYLEGGKYKEYILVTDHTSKILFSGTYQECVVKANLIRRGNGEVTIFRATKG